MTRRQQLEETVWEQHSNPNAGAMETGPNTGNQNRYAQPR